MAIVKVSDDGSITIPGEMLDRHGIWPGDKVHIMDFSGTIRIIPVAEDPIAAARGMFKGERSMTAALLEERRWELEQEERDLPPPRPKP